MAHGVVQVSKGAIWVSGTTSKVHWMHPSAPYEAPHKPLFCQHGTESRPTGHPRAAADPVMTPRRIPRHVALGPQ